METDCPYLAPQPKRGKRNEPAYVLHIAQALADLYNLSLDDIARMTTRNARMLFGLGTDPSGNTLVYPIRNSLYVNVTNACNMGCVFCPRETEPVVKGHDLRLDHDPTMERPVSEGDLRRQIASGQGPSTNRPRRPHRGDRRRVTTRSRPDPAPGPGGPESVLTVRRA